MNIQEQINAYIASQDGAKRSEMQALHQRIVTLLPNSRLWFLDGKDEAGKVITNPNIGYGQFIKQYKDGSTKEFYQIGISGNTTGISVYIMGLEDKTYLPQTYGATIGKSSVTGYCIKFKTINNIHLDILEAAIRDGVAQTNNL